MTNIFDNIKYNQDLIPIYIVEWSVRDHNLERFEKWINSIPSLVLYASFMTKRNSPNIILYKSSSPIIRDKKTIIGPEILNINYPEFAENLPDVNIHEGGWIPDNILNNLTIYSPKFNLLFNNVSPPCVIYCPYVEKYGLYFIHEIMKYKGVPILRYLKHEHTDRDVTMFLRQNKYGIILTNDLISFIGIDPKISIYIVNLDSDNGMQLLISPHYHENIYIYINIDTNMTTDMIQYRLLSMGINDCNRVFQNLINNSKKITIDHYNILYIS